VNKDVLFTSIVEKSVEDYLIDKKSMD